MIEQAAKVAEGLSEAQADLINALSGAWKIVSDTEAQLEMPAGLVRSRTTSFGAPAMLLLAFGLQVRDYLRSKENE